MHQTLDKQLSIQVLFTQLGFAENAHIQVWIWLQNLICHSH